MLPTSRRGGSFLPRSPSTRSGSPSKSMKRSTPSARRRSTWARCKSEWMTLFTPPTWASRYRNVSSIGARSSRSRVRHSGGFGEARFLGMSELTESPESGSEGSGRRFEHAAEILLGERLGVPEPRMAVDESVMQRRRRPSEIGCDIESRLLEILVRVYLPIQGVTPTVAEPREQVVRLDVLGRHPKDDAVHPMSECDLAEKSGHVRELTGMEPS